MLITVPDSRTQYFSCQTVRRLFDLLTEQYTRENNGSFRRETNESGNTCLIHNVSVCCPSCYVSRMLLNSVDLSCRKGYCPQNRKYSASTMIGLMLLSSRKDLNMQTILFPPFYVVLILRLCYWTFLGPFAKLRKATIRFAMSVRLSNCPSVHLSVCPSVRPSA